MINGVAKHQITDDENVNYWVEEAMARRKIKMTNQNTASSRSHLIFCLELTISPLLDEATALPRPRLVQINFGRIKFKNK